MNITEVINVLEQYNSEGQDMNAVIAAAQTLADTGKTPLGLNQWKLTDKPRMEEFNEDNRIIDQQLRNKADIEPVLWHYPDLLNGAENAPWSTVKYRKELNTVYLEGAVQNVSLHEVLFLLPEGFRPYQTIFVNTEQGLANVETHPTARLQITAGGGVSVIASGNKNLLESMWVSVSCCYTAK